jgi:hypothetical protein
MSLIAAMNQALGRRTPMDQPITCLRVLQTEESNVF